MKKITQIILLLSVFIINSGAVKAELKREVNLTVYNQNLAMVKDKRVFSFQAGLNKINFDEVPIQIDPTSVIFKSITLQDSCLLLEQNFEYDFSNTNKLLDKYKGEKIQVITQTGDIYSGTLVDYDPENIIIAENIVVGPVELVRRSNLKEIRFPNLPQGLVIKPTLVWNIDSPKEGNQVIEVSYLTKGINWHSEYTAVLDSDEKNLRINNWVSIDNQSGMDFPETQIRLVAGDINLIREQRAYPMLFKKDTDAAAASAPHFEESPFYEYYLYTLDVPVTLKDKSTKQISLFNTQDITMEKVYSMDNQKAEDKIRVAIRFKNTKNNGLGIPLPAGRFRIYKRTSADTLEFLGEDKIKHAPADKEIEINSGFAFDLEAKRKVLSQRRISERAEEVTVEITLHNYKKEKVTIEVAEHFYGDWEILEAGNHEYIKKDAETVIFSADVQAKGEDVLTYTVRRKF